MRRLIVLFSLMFLTACQSSITGQTPGETGSLAGAAAADASTEPKKTAFVRMTKADLPLDAESGAYKVCLSAAQVQEWADARAGRRAPRRSDVLAPITGSLGSLVTGVGSVGASVGGLAFRSIDVSQRVFGTGNPDEKSSPICGNWCGGGHPRDYRTDPKPTDPLDAACRRHDLCIKGHGMQTCACDQALADEILAGRQPQDLSSVELAIVTYFAGSPCDRGCKQVQLFNNNNRVCGNLPAPYMTPVPELLKREVLYRY